MERNRWYKDMVFTRSGPAALKTATGTVWAIFGACWRSWIISKFRLRRHLVFSHLPSPGADCGYDIADYMDIAPEFGGMEAFKKCFRAAMTGA